MRPNSSPPEGGSIMALHRSRLFDWAPSPVVCISACPGAALAAVGYETGDLELWDLNLMYCVQRVTGESVEVTCLAWALDGISGQWRSFAGHLDGSLAEVHWKEGALVAPIDSAGGTIWALASQPQACVKPGYSHQLAAACDDGGVRLFGVEGGEHGAQFERLLCMLQGKLLACSWHPDGEVIAAGGSDGCAHLLDAASGRELMRITISSSSLASACVWQLVLLPNGTLVSGDSEGAVQFFDAQFGTLLQRYQRHSADVVALAASPDGSAVFASGVDPVVALFRPVAKAPSDSADSTWTYLHYKRPHTHDVRAMAVVTVSPGKLVLLSGGVDAQLIAYPVASFLQEHPVRLCKAPQQPICHISAVSVLPPPSDHEPANAKKKLKRTGGDAAEAAATAGQLPTPPSRLLCTHNKHCDVWQLALASAIGQSAGALPHSHAHAYLGEAPPPQEGDPLDLVTGPRHLVRIKLGGRVTCSAISPCGTFVAASGPEFGVRLYRLGSETMPADSHASNSKLAVLRVPLPPKLARATALVFTASLALVLAHADGSLACLQLSTDADLKVTSVGNLAPRVLPLSETAIAAASQLPGAPARLHGLNYHWRTYHPHVSTLVANRSGTMVAAAGAHGISLVQVPAPTAGTSSSSASDSSAQLQYSGCVLRTPGLSPISGMDFSADGKLLAAVLSSSRLVVFDVQAEQRTPWDLEHDAAIGACLARLPCAPSGCSFNPDPQSSQLLVYSPGGFCHFEVGKGPPSTAFLKQKRTRDRRAASSEPAALSRGTNGRAVLVQDPCVFVGHISAAGVVLLEKPWSDVCRGFAPPLYKHRYGT